MPQHTSSTSGFLFKATDLHLERRYDYDLDLPSCTLKFFGTATLGADRIALANKPKSSRKRLHFIAEASKPQAKRPPWNVSLGYNATDARLGLAEEWYLQCSLPENIFEALKHDYLEGRTDMTCTPDCPRL